MGLSSNSTMLWRGPYELYWHRTSWLRRQTPGAAVCSGGEALLRHKHPRREGLAAALPCAGSGFPLTHTPGGSRRWHTDHTGSWDWGRGPQFQPSPALVTTGTWGVKQRMSAFFPTSNSSSRSLKKEDDWPWHGSLVAILALHAPGSCMGAVRVLAAPLPF